MAAAAIAEVKAPSKDVMERARPTLHTPPASGPFSGRSLCHFAIIALLPRCNLCYIFALNECTRAPRDATDERKREKVQTGQACLGRRATGRRTSGSVDGRAYYSEAHVRNRPE
ncbi:hypothetical protein MRX96_059721 [Rhipicephalus microplus]